jgi:hypothetical protein
MKIKQFVQSTNLLQRFVLILFFIFILYIVIGYFVLPHIVKNQIVKNVRELTNREVSLEEVRFNPLVLSLTLQNFEVKGKKDKSFIKWQEFYVNFQLSSIFRLAWTFDEIRLTKPNVFIEKETVDTFNFSDLISKQTTAKDESGVESKDEIPALIIAKLICEDGSIHFRDSSRSKEANLFLKTISLELNQFKTHLRPEQTNAYDLKASGPRGGSIHLSGGFRLDPIESKGMVELSGIDLTSFVNFYEDELQFNMPSGALSLNTQYHIIKKVDWSVDILQGDYTLSDMEVTEKESKNTLFMLPLLNINNVGLSLDEQKVSVGTITLKDANFNPSINNTGTINFLKAFNISAFTDANESAGSTETINTKIIKPVETAKLKETGEHSWYWEVGKIDIDTLGVNFTDHTFQTQTPFTYKVLPINLKVSDIVSDGHKPFNLKFSGHFNEKGSIEVSSQGTIKPVSLSIDIIKKELALKDFQPYINPFVHLTILDGIAEGNMHIDVNLDRKGELSKFESMGDLYLKRLNLQDNVADKDLLKWQECAIKGIVVNAISNNATIDKITIMEPHLNFRINEDMGTNIQQLIVSDKKDTSDDTAITEKALNKEAASVSEPETLMATKENLKNSEIPFHASVNEIVIKNGTASFADLSLTPDFVTEVGQLNGFITGISNFSEKTATIDIKGKVDRHAPVSIEGYANLFSNPQSADVTVSFKNIELSSFTPYSGTYAGYKIDKGQLSIDFHYLLKANKLQGDNKIVIHKLEFGDEVESDKAVSLPLKLAVALLSDSNGVIDLELLVKGDLNDLEFNIGAIVWKVLKNVIVKAVTAPFRLLADLIGGDEDEDLDSVTFAPGRDLPEGPESKKVVKLADALEERPQLSLNIRGQVAYESDLQNLKQTHLNNTLTAISKINAQKINGILVAAQNLKWRDALYDLYKESLNESWIDARDRLLLMAELKGEKIDDETLFNKTIKTIYNALLEKQPVTDENLYSLADHRAQNIKVELVENHAIDPGRIFILASEVAPDSNNSAVKLTLDAQ